MRTLTSLLFIWIGVLGAHAQFTFQGYVLNSFNKTPVANAVIEISQQGSNSWKSSTTQANGTFTFVLFEGGVFQLRAKHISYEAYVSPAPITISSASDPYLIELIPTAGEIETTIVSAIRADRESPTTFTNLNKEEIDRLNTGQDMPFVLSQTPSAVIFSDAGAGVGYTGIRIRGVDQTRINTTINGVPLNDAESHGVFWVDLPDLASSSSSIQVQRGVGTSSNGAASFGASINLKTDAINPKPFARFQTGYGSFNTFRQTVEYGTGKLENNWGFQGRLSKITSDGFIDRASSDLSAAFFTAARYGERSLLKFNVMLGRERTYQAWSGVPQVKFQQDQEGVEQYINQLYLSDAGARLLRNSDYNTYNPYTYQNQVDDYGQDHYQAFYQYRFKNQMNFHGGLYYTRGKGYYEGLNDNFNQDTSSKLFHYNAHRQWLDNHLGGFLFSLKGSFREINWIWGGDVNRYWGFHYDEGVSPVDFNGPYSVVDNRDTAIKTTATSYLKGSKVFGGNWLATVDLQVRNVNYHFRGPDNAGNLLPQSVNLLFFNPKIGVSGDMDIGLVYATFGRSNREPVRNDFVESSPNSRPQSETLNNVELGVRGSKAAWTYAVNLFGMYYQDQLVLTGAVNDVGAYTRTNVERSSRQGIELDLGYKKDRFFAGGNIAYNQSNIVKWIEYVGVGWGGNGEIATTYENTPIAFTPEFVSSFRVGYKIAPWLEVMLQGKGVSDQYLDNTGSEDRKLEGFLVYDAVLYGKLPIQFLNQISYQVNVFNLLDRDFAPNGYTFSNIDGSGPVPVRQDFNVVYPMAGRYVMAKLILEL